MHNSLFIRDLLKQANRSAMRLERRDPHRRAARAPGRVPADGEIELKGPWKVVCQADPAVAERIVADAADFLKHMGVIVSTATPQSINLSIAEDLGARDCRLEVTPRGIAVAGGGPAGLWAGLAWLEWEMRTRRGPFLPVGRFDRPAAWGVQISQGPWGGNYSVPDFSEEYLSDDAFRLYAHYGVNSMMIYGDLLCYAHSEVFPELNCPDFQANLAMLADAARRAEPYGVRFTYVPVGPKLRADHPLFKRLPEVRGSGLRRAGSPGAVHCLCSASEHTAEFYRETFSRLFTEVPQLAGLILIVGGESMYHCRTWAGAEVRCGVCGAKTTEEVVADLVRPVQEAVRSAQPEAFVAAWAYNVSGWERPERLQLVRQLPEGAAIYHHVEKDQQLRKDRYFKDVWDYSIDYTGPSDNMLEIARVAGEVRRPLFVKTETGVGLEVFQFPYVPAMQRLAEKWEKVRALRPAGVQQSWLFFGMFGSRAEELGLWAAYAPEMPREEFLRRMAVRDFGPAAAEEALAAWQHMSRAMGHLPFVTYKTYYVGPSFLGPAHPLVPTPDAAVPDVFYARLFYRQEGEETFSRRQIDEVETCLVLTELPSSPEECRIRLVNPADGWNVVIDEYAAAAAEAEAAWEGLAGAEALAQTDGDAANLRDEALLAELVFRTQTTCEAVTRFLLARRWHEQTSDPAYLARMRTVAEQEKRNALAALQIYEVARWLDLAERTDGRFASCADMIAAKVDWIDEFLG